MAGQQDEAHEIAECIGERQDLGGHAASGAAYGLALSPPFAPWPWRWTLTMVASTMAYSMSGSSEQARSEEHTYELQSLMRISYAVFCWKKKKKNAGNKASFKL